MEGRGVTNYATDKPSFAFSTSTTEFDDELMKRDIVTLEQAFMAKGASEEEANRLASIKRNNEQQHNVDVVVDNGSIAVEKKNEPESDEDDFEDDDDDEFMTNYRRQRLEQLIRKESRGPYGRVVPISRQDWTREVNQESVEAWVVVTLTSHDVERTGCVEDAVNKLAHKIPTVKFVTIPSKAAIDNWPDENLPSIFLYRHGSLQKELIRLQRTMTSEELEWELTDSGVMETKRREDNPIRDGEVAYSKRFARNLVQLGARRHDSDEDDCF